MRQLGLLELARSLSYREKYWENFFLNLHREAHMVLTNTQKADPQKMGDNRIDVDLAFYLGKRIIRYNRFIGSVFGSYNVHFGLFSNIIWRLVLID